jgi:exonuclease III
MAVSSVNELNLNVISYNLHGLNQGNILLSKLAESNIADFIFVQEHWLTPMNMYKIRNFSRNYLCFGISAMEQAVSKSILRGRSFGGVAILVRNELCSKVKCIQSSERFVVLKFNQTLFINVYLPCHSADNCINIVIDMFAAIGNIIQNNVTCGIILGGDLNTDLYDNSDVSRFINSFCSDYVLDICNNIIPPNCDYTYCHEGLQQFSYLDYFLVSKNTTSNLIDHAVLDNELNMSDHLPISLTIRCNDVSMNLAVNVADKNTENCCNKVSNLRWDHANLFQYYEASYTALLPIYDRLNDLYLKYKLCDGLPEYGETMNNFNGISAVDHSIITSLIDVIYDEIVATLSKVALDNVPCMKKNYLKFWWNQELNELKAQAVATHHDWLAAGKPHSGPVFEARKKGKYSYKSVIRQRKMQQTDSISNSLHDALINKDHTTFWKMWKSKMGSKNGLPKNVNNFSNEPDIANAFAKSFSDACSSNSTDRNIELFNEFSAMKLNYLNDHYNHDYSISIELVDKMIYNLKNGKAASSDNLTAEHIKHCHPIIVSLLTKLFNIMLSLGYVPNSFGIGLTVPIPKCDTGSKLCSTEDYRGITVSPVISKIFEHCLLFKFDKYLISSDSQFGFKKNNGVNHALYSVRKTVEYFIDRDSTVSLCALDLSKAFDKLNKYALFIKLMKRKCPLIFINILHCWYEKTFTCVKWGDAISQLVKLSVGVRQGGVLSPFLFAVCVDDILIILNKSNLGCHIKSTCFNAFMYADDLLLLSISVCDLQQMIDLCKAELDWLDMIINVKKSASIRIGKRVKSVVSCLVVNDQKLAWVDEVKYLGIYIMSAASFKCNLHYTKMKFYRALNGILGKIGSSSSIDVTLSLVSSFANPVLLFGLETGCLTRSQIDKLSNTFNSIYMKLFSTFDKAIIAQCQYYTYQLPLRFLLHLRYLTFWNGLRLIANSPARILYDWFGDTEKQQISSIYDILPLDSHNSCKRKIWQLFQEQINIL